MVYEELKKNYEKTEDSLKADFIEWLVICNYMDQIDFENLFRLETLSEAEFFSITDFLWQQECFMTLFMIMAHHMKRFQHEDLNNFEEVDISESTEERIKKLNSFKCFKVPKML